VELALLLGASRQDREYVAITQRVTLGFDWLGNTRTVNDILTLDLRRAARDVGLAFQTQLRCLALMSMIHGGLVPALSAVFGPLGPSEEYVSFWNSLSNEPISYTPLPISGAMLSSLFSHRLNGVRINGIPHWNAITARFEMPR